MKNLNPKWSLIGLVIVLAIGSGVYRLIVYTGYDSSGILFIGLPAILAVLLIAAPNMTSPSAQVFKGITIFLLIVGVMAWEGAICILMAAPLFYLMGFVILGLSRLARRRDKLRSVALIPITLMSMEGLNQNLSFSRENEVIIRRTIEMSEEEFLAKISMAPVVDLTLPAFFQLGFPHPVEVTASGDFSGRDRTNYVIVFSGPDDLENRLEVAGQRAERQQIDFAFEKNNTKIASWLVWEAARISWEVDDEKLVLCFHQTYRRILDPYWYFNPIQHYAVKLAGNYLLDGWLDE